MASDEIERPANRTRMAASLIEPIISMKQSAVEAATAIANEAAFFCGWWEYKLD